MEKRFDFHRSERGWGTVQMGSLDGKPGLSPMHLLLIAVAGCTGMDTLPFYKKSACFERFAGAGARQTCQGLPDDLDGYHITYLVWGEAIQPRTWNRPSSFGRQVLFCWTDLGKAARITSEYHLLNPANAPNKGAKNERTN